MRRIITLLILSVMVSWGAKAEGLFPYALVPDSISTLEGRCNYLAMHFWDHCDMGAAMSKRQALADELETYLNILLNAEAKTAQEGITKMLKKVEKHPQDMLFLTQKAERLLYGDSAVTWVDELYMPFLEATVGNKKIDKVSKARYQHQLHLLKNSLVGSKAGNLKLVFPDGSKGNLDDYNAQALVVFFYDPTCDDCHLARMRLNGDIATSTMVEKGVAKIVAVSLTEADDVWKEDAATWPKEWVIAASEDADMEYDMRGGNPSFYVIDRDHIIRFKNLAVEQVMDIMTQLKNR